MMLSPQGSILGASLFIIYIKDIKNVIEKYEIVLYANDTLIFTKCKTSKECYVNIEKIMENRNKWLKITN